MGYALVPTTGDQILLHSCGGFKLHHLIRKNLQNSSLQVAIYAGSKIFISENKDDQNEVFNARQGIGMVVFVFLFGY